MIFVNSFLRRHVNEEMRNEWDQLLKEIDNEVRDKNDEWNNIELKVAMKIICCILL